MRSCSGVQGSSRVGIPLLLSTFDLKKSKRGVSSQKFINPPSEQGGKQEDAKNLPVLHLYPTLVFVFVRELSLYLLKTHFNQIKFRSVCGPP
mmetsp:Transcript_27410/g.42356  ORF Transcript_27410/g.42356 Transcript_27410/m.42356 type:complete len:92 (+) Transcript_27410:54-329(+)